MEVIWHLGTGQFACQQPGAEIKPGAPAGLSEATRIFLAGVERWAHASATLKTWEHLANTVWVLVELPAIASKNALAMTPMVVSLVSQLEEDKKLFCQTPASILLWRNPFNAFSI